MKFKGEKYRTLIKELNRLKVFDKKAYQSKLSEVEVSTGYSIKTIYRDMQKEKTGKVAGLRKSRKDTGTFRNKTTQQEKELITELMKAGKTKQEAAEIASGKTGKPISVRKASRIKPEEHLPLTKGETQRGSENRPSLFGEEARKFFEHVFELDMIAPDCGIPVKFKNVSFTVGKETLSDIILALTNEYNRKADAGQKLQLDRKALMKAQIFNLLSYQIALAKASGNIKDVASITLMYQRMEIDYGSLSPDFKTVEKICHILKPEITDDEIFGLIEKFSDAR
jgi:hypothetical protein